MWRILHKMFSFRENWDTKFKCRLWPKSAPTVESLYNPLCFRTWSWHLHANLTFEFLTSICGQNYTLEWFSEAGSAPIRSAVTFYFDIDVRIFFSTSSKNIFRSIKKKFENFRKSWKFSKSLKFSKSRDFHLFSTFFCRSKKYFLKKLRKKSGHQYWSKISLRIEWEHSQRLKTTLEYSFDHK